MTNKIFKYYDEFVECQLIIITEAEISQAIKFSEEFELNNNPNISLVLDSKLFMYKHYGLVEYPSFIIYSSDKKHIRTIDEFITFPLVVKYVREAIAKGG
jgi:hypothetical protein